MSKCFKINSWRGILFSGSAGGSLTFGGTESAGWKAGGGGGRRGVRVINECYSYFYAAKDEVWRCWW